MAVFHFSKTALKNLFQKPATEAYPVQKKVFFPRSRGHIAIDIDSCIFCGLCSRKCPTGAIEVKKAEKGWSINRLRCIQCNSCVENCPKKCLSMDNQYTAPSGGEVKDEYHARVPDNL